MSTFNELYTVLTALVGLTSVLLLALAILEYIAPFHARAAEIRRKQDLAVSAHINSLHETIQALTKQRNMYRREYSVLVTQTRMNDSGVTAVTNPTAQETRS